MCYYKYGIVHCYVTNQLRVLLSALNRALFRRELIPFRYVYCRFERDAGKKLRTLSGEVSYCAN